MLGRVSALVKSGKDIIRLDVGEPDFGTPDPVIAAAQSALTGRGEARIGRYTGATARPELREAVANFYRSRYDVSIDPSQVLITTGSSAGRRW
ncbi:aminotransferase class I/II-fold pyridoxal phosphate-dependent enzyme [Paraburkholderia sp. 32]|uniref:aminotransferase class I/II-fold pyridoxal phosphate-dependent enzyme n=1 Tax=Paraburkholderia sp. 32 TaxID=2991057 RepID=UPI003D1E128F